MSCPPTTIFSVPGDETCQFLHGISCIHYSLLLKLENVCSLPCLQMMAPLRPLRTITQMSLLNLLLNLLRKCHYSNHYSSLLKGHFHYSSLLTHYAMGTLLMQPEPQAVPCPLRARVPRTKALAPALRVWRRRAAMRWARLRPGRRTGVL